MVSELVFRGHFSEYSDNKAFLEKPCMLTICLYFISLYVKTQVFLNLWSRIVIIWFLIFNNFFISCLYSYIVIFTKICLKIKKFLILYNFIVIFFAFVRFSLCTFINLWQFAIGERNI